MIRYKIFRRLGFLGILVFLASCEYEKTEPLNPNDLPDVVSYAEHIQPVFDANCIKCHGGSTAPDLTAENSYFDLTNGNYIDTQDPENSYLYQKISGNGSMAQHADDYQRALILKWIEQGAEDN
jgi:mono/diheme cytochrome c family protein